MLFFIGHAFKLIIIDSDKIKWLAIPNYFCIILGYLGGLVYVKNRKTLGLSLGTLGLLLGILYITQFKYFGQYYSYRNITGTVKEPISVNDLLLTDARGNNLVLDSDVYYVMDFWHTRCAECFRSMPKINNWHELNKNPKVQYLLVNKPLAHFDTLGQAFAIIKEKGMSIPNYVGTENIDSLMGVPEFPTIVVVKNKEIIFRGRNDIFSEQRLARLMQ